MCIGMEIINSHPQIKDQIGLLNVNLKIYYKIRLLIMNNP